MQIGLSAYTYPWAVGVPGPEPTKPLKRIALQTSLSWVGFCTAR